MDSLHVAIENRFEVDRLPGRPAEPVGKLLLGFPLGSSERVLERLVTRQRLKPGQLTQVGDPSITNRFGNCTGEGRIGEQQPATRGDAVRLIIKSLWKYIGKVFDGRLAQ